MAIVFLQSPWIDPVYSFLTFHIYSKLVDWGWSHLFRKNSGINKSIDGTKFGEIKWNTWYYELAFDLLEPQRRIILSKTMECLLQLVTFLCSTSKISWIVVILSYSGDGGLTSSERTWSRISSLSWLAFFCGLWNFLYQGALLIPILSVLFYIKCFIIFNTVLFS